ncbi:DUF6268 family outer membrane beta-barrel protein [Hymenobacter sp. YC55]|uniref:DUF6268 family outer membrane beta-barrel protein n=1 Tax=Hymenobacter sp. YC55 TaxID=3034019 RepID=UPI0023F891F6|nr:DUF6268 family outer membrane beta-barrel protein [Hymenobacter sp. YC55]MDF7814100.1 DUF6268 family outer membrane beta-barrel protein [Hymenobacter sp. YC55]
MFTSLHSQLLGILAAAALALPQATLAQGYQEGVNLSSEFLPLTLKNPEGKKHDFRASVSRFNMGIPYFLKEDKSQYLILGVQSEAYSFHGTRPGFHVSNLYSVTPTLGYNRRLSDKLRMDAIFLPTLSSDFKRIKGEDFLFGGIVRGVYQVKPNFALRGSLGYREQYYGALYIVQVGLDWQVSEKVRIFGDAPTSLTINYTNSPKLSTGFDLLAGNSSYRLAQENQYLRYSFATPGVFAEYNLKPGLALRAKVGYSLIRNLEVFNENDKADNVDFVVLGDEPKPISPEIEKGLTFRLALSYRVFTK